MRHKEIRIVVLLLTVGFLLSIISVKSHNIGATHWTIETVENSGYFGWTTSIALDSKGLPHIAYFDTGNYTIKYAKWTGQSWNIETVDSVSDHYFGLYLQTTLKIDSNNHPHIVYAYSSITNLINPIYDVPSYNYSCALKYAKRTEGSWSIVTVDSVVGGGYPNLVQSSYPSLALDSHDYPHISYYFENELKYAKWIGKSWSFETVDSSGDPDRAPSIALDNNEYPHISYSIDENLKYAKWTGNYWNTEIVNRLSDDPLLTPSLALDNDGYVHILYSINPRNLTYAKWSGGSWDIKIFNIQTYRSSLALDNCGHPHISSVGPVGLEYIKWNGIAWKNETIDSTGAKAPSLILDDEGYSHIAYFDESQHLKYAKGKTFESNRANSANSANRASPFFINIVDYNNFHFDNWSWSIYLFPQAEGTTTRNTTTT